MIVFVITEKERGIQIKTQSHLNKVVTVHIVFFWRFQKFHQISNDLDHL